MKTITYLLSSVVIAGLLLLTPGVASAGVNATKLYPATVNIYPSHGCTSPCIAVKTSASTKFNPKRTPKVVQFQYRSLNDNGNWEAVDVRASLKNKATDLWVASTKLKGACSTRYGAVDSTLVSIIFSNKSQELIPIHVAGITRCPGM
jgi:hypothetical protein